MERWEFGAIILLVIALIITITLVTPNTEKEYKIVHGHIESVSVGINEERISYLNVSINSTHYNLIWDTWVNTIIVNYADNPYYTIEMFQYTTPPQKHDTWHVTTVVIS